MNAQRASAGGDFLASVVDRAQERATVVVPRPSSLFEPAAPPHPVALDIDDAAAPGSAGRDAPLPGVHVHAEPSDAAERSQLAQVSPPALLPAGDMGAEAGAARDRVVPATAYEMRGETPRLHETRMQSIDRDIAPPPLLVARETPTAMPDVTPRTRAPTGLGDEVCPLPRAPDEAKSRADPVAAPQRESLLPQRAITAEFMPLQAPERGSASASAPVVSAASVTISIGRVEVRAAAPAAQPTSPAKATRQPMRLDEYLARKERAR
ncbi:MAG: hypothetical protein ABI843_12290 [Dokdonella sp.]